MSRSNYPKAGKQSEKKTNARTKATGAEERASLIPSAPAFDSTSISRREEVKREQSRSEPRVPALRK